MASSQWGSAFSSFGISPTLLTISLSCLPLPAGTESCGRLGSSIKSLFTFSSISEKSASNCLMFSFISEVRSFAALASSCFPWRNNSPISFEILFMSALALSASTCNLFFCWYSSVIVDTIVVASKFLSFSFSITSSGLSCINLMFSISMCFLCSANVRGKV